MAVRRNEGDGPEALLDGLLELELLAADEAAVELDCSLAGLQELAQTLTQALQRGRRILVALALGQEHLADLRGSLVDL